MGSARKTSALLSALLLLAAGLPSPAGSGEACREGWDGLQALYASRCGEWRPVAPLPPGKGAATSPSLERLGRDLLTRIDDLLPCLETSPGRPYLPGSDRAILGEALTELAREISGARPGLAYLEAYDGTFLVGRVEMPAPAPPRPADHDCSGKRPGARVEPVARPPFEGCSRLPESLGALAPGAARCEEIPGTGVLSVVVRYRSGSGADSWWRLVLFPLPPECGPKGG